MEGFVSETFVEVLLDQNLAKPLDYRVPEGCRVEVGMRVEVPLKSKFQKGVIAKVKNETQWPNVKPIRQVLSQESELSPPLWKLAHWMAKYYATSLQKVLKVFIPVNVRKEVKEKTELFLKLKKTDDECIQAIASFRLKFPGQAIALEELLHHPKGVFFSQLNLSKSSIGSLMKKGFLTASHVTKNEDLLLEQEFFPTQPKKLNVEQKNCLDAISISIQSHSFAAHLIHGVTGSGKTEVYMQAIQMVLEQNKSAIMLVPEISLTSQTIERFKARFSEKIAILHHRRSLGERTTAWQELKNGEAKLVIGARSAIFSPAQNLGLIIVDEEHDSSYKQSEEAPCYQGRDVAVMRAHLESCPILLGSATPSLESRYNAEVGKYFLHELKNRATSAPLPRVKIIDMKQSFEKIGGFTHFSDELLEALKERLSKGEQALFLLNRRGYHRMQICSSCRHVIKCPHCDLSLTFHKQSTILQCHLCDHKEPQQRKCPNCGQLETLEFRGFGTEHVERTLHAIFPDIRTLRMDKDTTAKKNSHEECFKQFRAHKADVLIGTQMIAKGFHFPSVTLVGVLNADATLNLPDFRSSERLFQLLTQVAGRAGRAELPGEVIIQTFLPDHPTLHLAAAQDYSLFYEQEIQERRRFHYPPFCHLIKFLFTDSDEAKAKQAADSAHKQLKMSLDSAIEILPVMPSGHAKIKDKYRFQFFIKVSKMSQLKESLQELLEAKMDVDPLSTYF